MLLAAVRRGVQVSVVLHDDKINRESRIDWNALCSAGVTLHWYTSEEGTMHHKFCVVDKRFCLFGTYNWTYYASKFNRETFFVLDNDTVASVFRLEFRDLLKSEFVKPPSSKNIQNKNNKNIEAPTILSTRIKDVESAKAEVLAAFGNAVERQPRGSAKTPVVTPVVTPPDPNAKFTDFVVANKGTMTVDEMIEGLTVMGASEAQIDAVFTAEKIK